MPNHQQKINKISHQLKNRNSASPLSLKKKAPPHQVPKPRDRRLDDEKIDISDLHQILHIDLEKKICIAEPGVTFTDLLKETLKYNLVPMVVPELKTITIGGAVSGCSIESMSFKYGGFHDSCLEYEIITGKGDVLICTPTNEYRLLFQMVHGAFGTLGIISKLKFKLIPSKPFIKITYEKYNNIEDYKKAIWGHFTKKDVDYMDGIIHSPQEYVLCVADFVDSAPYTNSYYWMKIYYLTTNKLKEDYLKTYDYFFRYDKGVTNVNPKSFLGRLLFGWLTNSTNTLAFAKIFNRWLPEHLIPMTLDVMIPFSKITGYLQWHTKIVKHYPLWCVPYKVVREYEWISEDYISKNSDQLFLDIAIYAMRKNKDINYYRLIEEELMRIGGIKTLISNNYYSEADFWKVFNKENYYNAKRIADPDNIFRDLYTKTCKAVMGL